MIRPCHPVDVFLGPVRGAVKLSKKLSEAGQIQRLEANINSRNWEWGDNIGLLLYLGQHLGFLDIERPLHRAEQNIDA
ncbi:hypothetical protein J6590_101283 [Homalodisca vitripennis]|nr:hypothetical protein J6590_101283 [Homalodisca vitripennis]